MGLDTMVVRSRRALLAGAAGVFGALVAQALGRPLPARAEGEIVHVGDEFTTATSVTSIRNETNDAPVFAATSTGSGRAITATSIGDHAMYASGGAGSAGLYALGLYDGSAVVGTVGVAPAARPETGVFGRAWRSTGCGVMGFGGGVGVYGFCGDLSSTPPPQSANTGVYGYAAVDTASRGVFGQTTAGQGVRGQATSGRGVRGYATSGIAGEFGVTTGWAIQSSGRLSFGRVSGIATIAAGTATETVTPGVELGSATFVLLTPRGNLGTRALWYTVDTAANTFTIRLSSNVAGDTSIGWLVIG